MLESKRGASLNSSMMLDKEGKGATHPANGLGHGGLGVTVA